MCKFKIGDKVRRVANYGHGHVPSWGIAVVTGVPDIRGNSIYLDNDTEYTHHTDSYELVEPAKTFTKSDLKDGMRVVYRNSDERYVLDGAFLRIYLVNGVKNFQRTNHVDSYTEDLLDDPNNGKSDLDIMKVIDRDGTVLFEREEKSQQEIEMEKLQKQIAELQEQANKLKQSMK